MKLRSLAPLLAGLAVAAPVAPAAAQSAVTDSSRLTVERIYASRDFAGDPLGPIRWLDGGSYLILVRPETGGGRDVVRVDAETGRREVLIRAAQLTAPGDTAPMAIEDIAWTPDLGKFLVYTNSQPVWRQNTRGDYWVFDRGAGTLKQLGGPDQAKAVLDAAREKVRKAGLGEVHFAAFTGIPQSIPDVKRAGFDSMTSYNVTTMSSGAGSTAGCTRVAASSSPNPPISATRENSALRELTSGVPSRKPSRT